MAVRWNGSAILTSGGIGEHVSVVCVCVRVCVCVCACVCVCMVCVFMCVYCEIALCVLHA